MEARSLSGTEERGPGFPFQEVWFSSSVSVHWSQEAALWASASLDLEQMVP